MRPRSLSIRHILLLTVSVLTLSITLLAAREVYVNWLQLTKIHELKKAMAVSDQMFNANEKLADERDIAYTILHAPDPATIDNLQLRLIESRQAADAAFLTSMQALQAYDFPELLTIRSEIEKQLSSIHLLRRQIDETMAERHKQSDKTLSDRWFAESTALIVQTQDLWVEFSRHFTDINPIVTQHLRYKHFLRIISDYTGRERAIISRLIVENTDPTPEELAQLLSGHGTIEMSWKIAYVLANQSNLYASIGPYFTDAQSHYQTLYDMVRDLFYTSGTRHGAPSPIGVDLWLELSAQAKESFDGFRSASLQEIQHSVDRLDKQTLHVIFWHSLLLFLSLCLCLYSFRVITYRVIRPIDSMVTALLDAISGKQVSFSPAEAHRNDEIGKLAQVLYAFQETGERYRALVESSTQVVWIWKEGALDIDSPLGRWWEETTGQPAEAIATVGWLDVVHPDDRDAVQKIWEVARAEARNYDMEYRMRARNGTYIHVAIRGVALKAADGSLREFIGTLNDVTARKEAEAALLRYTAALERSNRELDDFAYIASHDLKEPLRGLFNHATFLLEDYNDKLDEDGVRKLHRLSYLAQRMEKLVNDLLYFSRLGRQDLAIQSTDMNAVIHDIESTLEVFLEERHARIIIPTPLPTITCDQTRITEVFRNLITNAVKYNDKPEKTVEIGFKDRHQLPSGEFARNVFYVKDNGKGIPEEFYDEIFRIFKRLQSSKDSGEDGTGAGLTFVKKIIERHGGKVWLESEVGAGTSFWFTLEA